MRIYTVVCVVRPFYNIATKSLPCPSSDTMYINHPSQKTLSPSFRAVPSRFRSGQRKANQNNKGWGGSAESGGSSGKSDCWTGEPLRALSFRSQCSRLGSILISQVSTVCNSSLSRGGWASRSPPSPACLTRPCPSLASAQRNALSVTLLWLQLPNPLNVGKAWNDEELGFFYTGDVLCLSMFPCGQQDQLEDTGDPLVVKGQAASPTSPRRAVCSRNAGGFWPFQPHRDTTAGYILFIYCGQISNQEFYWPLNYWVTSNPCNQTVREGFDTAWGHGTGLGIFN